MPQSRKQFPNPAPGYVYKGAMETFVVMKVFRRGTRKYVKAFAVRSHRVTTILLDSFLSYYGIRACLLP